jgi:hypothetical protein
MQKHGILYLAKNEIQLCLLKRALLLGVKVSFQQGICGILEPNDQNKNWRVWTLSEEEASLYLKRPIDTSALSLKPSEVDAQKFKKVSKVDFFERAISDNGAIKSEPDGHFNSLQIHEFDSLLIAEGESSKLIRILGFDRKLTKYANAIGIVVNMFYGPDENPKLSEEVKSSSFKTDLYIHMFDAAATDVKSLCNVKVCRELKLTAKETLLADNIGFDALRKLGRELASMQGVSTRQNIVTKTVSKSLIFPVVDSVWILSNVEETRI